MFIDSNYYILTVYKVNNNVYNKGFNNYFKDVEFWVRTKTGRNLENEIRSYNIKD